MPHGGVGHRARQQALLAGLCHERATDPRLGELLAQVEGTPLVAEADAPTAVNVRHWRRAYDRLTCLPRSLVEELARITSLAQQVWAEARAHADYARFQPWLDRIVALKRREAECLGFAVPYDALLDEYEPGAHAADLDQLFAALHRDVVPLLDAIRGAGRQANASFLCGAYPVERQRTFGEAVAATIGFDFERGRLDTTTHPFFTPIGPGDCRIATRFEAGHFSDGFFAILHEVGHALYEQGLDPAHYGTPMGECPSLGLHEAQARFWENPVGCARSFWVHFYPLAQQVFPEMLGAVPLDDFYYAINRVEPGWNRVRADEVTYDLHIQVRYQLERALIAGDLTAADLPDAWNQAYREHLGVTPANDAEGCLQDGHWSAGLIGYFPTYTLGNIYAAQLFAQARRELGDVEAAFARGDFGELLSWLRERVYREGHRYSAARLIERVTGAPPDHRPLVQALNVKYRALYGQGKPVRINE